jgi:recombination protein RecA
MLTEIFGAESSGKSSMCLALVAQAQKLGLKCAYVDMELAMTKELAEHMGVDTSNLVLARPTTGEEAFNFINDLMEKDVKLIVVDSVSSLVPGEELEADFDQQSIGLQARLMSKGMRKIIGSAMRNKVAVVFTNQIRDDIGKFGFGEKITTSGGRALRFYSAMRFRVARTGWIEKDKEKIGMSLKILTIKNKLYRPQLSTEVDFYFGSGFDKDKDRLEYMVSIGTLTRVGNTYYNGEVKIGDKEKAILWINTALTD